LGAGDQLGDATLCGVWGIEIGEIRTPLRGLGVQGIKEASISVRVHPGGPLSDPEQSEPKDIVLNVAVANGLANAKKLVADVEGGSKQYHFVEVRWALPPKRWGCWCCFGALLFRSPCCLL
jgi:Iron only hydrogenase large subunit, C-terminal domain